MGPTMVCRNMGGNMGPALFRVRRNPRQCSQNKSTGILDSSRPALLGAIAPPPFRVFHLGMDVLPHNGMDRLISSTFSLCRLAKLRWPVRFLSCSASLYNTGVVVE